MKCIEEISNYYELLNRIFYWPLGLRENLHFREAYNDTRMFFGC
jgi:hypothetical protein